MGKGELNMDKKYITTEEAALRLGVSKQYVREMLRCSKLRGKKLGKEWRIDPESVNEFLGITKVDSTKDQRIYELEHKINEYRLKCETMTGLLRTMCSVFEVQTNFLPVD